MPALYTLSLAVFIAANRAHWDDPYLHHPALGRLFVSFLIAQGLINYLVTLIPPRAASRPITLPCQ